ncbi:MAG: hypothetical protein FD123_4095 [Bacteroidetes bacterium]|nr:MAG: hypothetical protein FD123_4095 [Bacteroidota bacterium]
MAVDDIFKTLERRTEQDLYRMTFRMVASTQNELLQEIEANRKALMRRQIAKETLWFFASLLAGFLLGFATYEAAGAMAPGVRGTLLKFFSNNEDYVFYFLCILCFIGVYITRMTIWALKLL